MVLYSQHVVFNLGKYFLQKFFVVKGIWRAGKIEVLPYQKSQFVAHIIKSVAFVISAAPYSYHIHVACFRLIEQIAQFFVADVVDKAVGRYPIGASCEYLFAVDEETEIASYLVKFVVERYRSKSYLLRLLAYDCAVGQHFDIQIVERLCAHIVAPPKLRIFHA